MRVWSRVYGSFLPSLLLPARQPRLVPVAVLGDPFDSLQAPFLLPAAMRLHNGTPRFRRAARLQLCLGRIIIFNKRRHPVQVCQRAGL